MNDPFHALSTSQQITFFVAFLWVIAICGTIACLFIWGLRRFSLDKLVVGAVMFLVTFVTVLFILVKLVKFFWYF